MPKIEISEVGARSDKAETAHLRAIGDLVEIEQDKKMYINQKKQLQQLVMDLFDLGFYIDKNSIFDVL